MYGTKQDGWTKKIERKLIMTSTFSNQFSLNVQIFVLFKCSQQKCVHLDCTQNIQNTFWLESLSRNLFLECLF